MTQPLHRADVPPAPGPNDWIVRIPPNVGFNGQILSHEVVGYYTHWAGTTVECLQDADICPGCKTRLPQRWKGYLQCWDALKRKEVFVELTPDAAQQILLQRSAERSLRGLRIKAWRVGRNPKGRIMVEISMPMDTFADLPAPRDVEPILRTLWAWGRKA